MTLLQDWISLRRLTQIFGFELHRLEKQSNQRPTRKRFTNARMPRGIHACSCVCVVAAAEIDSAFAHKPTPTHQTLWASFSVAGIGGSTGPPQISQSGPNWTSSVGKQGPNSIEKKSTEKSTEKPLEFPLEIPYTKKKVKNGEFRHVTESKWNLK